MAFHALLNFNAFDLAEWHYYALGGQKLYRYHHRNFPSASILYGNFLLRSAGSGISGVDRNNFAGEQRELQG